MRNKIATELCTNLMYRVPEKSLTISWITLIFVSLLYVIWKMLATEQWISALSWKLNGLPFAEFQERFRRSYHTEAPTRKTIRGLVNKFQRTVNVCYEKEFCTVVDIAENCGDDMTDDRAESKSVNKTSQSGTRHSKVHCVANFALRTGEKGYQIRVLGLIQQRIFFFLKQQSRQHRTWTCLSKSWSPNCLPTTLWIGGVWTGRRPTTLSEHCA